LNFDLHSVEVFAIKPCDGTLGGGGIVIRHGGFALLVTGLAVFVDPDFWLASLLVVLDHADGSEKGCDVFFSQVGW